MFRHFRNWLPQIVSGKRLSMLQDNGFFSQSAVFPPCRSYRDICGPRVVQKSASTNLSRGLFITEPATRKTMVSDTKNIEVRDRHPRQIRETYKSTLYTNLQLEGNTGSFNRYIVFKNRFKGPKLKSRSQVKDSPEFIGAFYKGEYVSYSQNPISFKA